MTATPVASGERTPLEIAGRLDRLRAELTTAGHDALVVTHLPNVRYLTGFTGSAGTLVVTDSRAALVTDGRYRDQAAEQVRAAGAAASVVVAGTAEERRRALVDAVGGVRHVAVEDHDVTWARQRELAEWLEGAELVRGGTLVEDLRRVKDAGEVDRIAAACALADAAFAAVVPEIVGGPTERELALELEMSMRRAGADAVSFDPIVASGPHAALPHARPTDRVVGKGEMVVLDFGCVVDGYCSDMTRTVCVGEPSPEAAHVHEVVRAAQQAGRDAVRAGVEASVVDAACRDVIADAGLADAFSHSTGHGVGLEIHEAPRVAATSGDTLRRGDVVTVEPGVYLPETPGGGGADRIGAAGVRIEDTVVVTAAGADVLTHSPKDLVL